MPKIITVSDEAQRIGLLWIQTNWDKCTRWVAAGIARGLDEGVLWDVLYTRVPRLHETHNSDVQPLDDYIWQAVWSYQRKEFGHKAKHSSRFPSMNGMALEQNNAYAQENFEREDFLVLDYIEEVLSPGYARIVIDHAILELPVTAIAEAQGRSIAVIEAWLAEAYSALAVGKPGTL